MYICRTKLFKTRTMKNLLFIIILGFLFGCSPDYRIEQKIKTTKYEYYYSKVTLMGGKTKEVYRNFDFTVSLSFIYKDLFLINK